MVLAVLFVLVGSSTQSLRVQPSAERDESLQRTAPAPPNGSQTGGAEARYETYKNKHYNFSFAYPSDWRLKEGLDGNGLGLTPPQRDGLHFLPPPFPLPTIRAGGHMPQPNDIDDPSALGPAPPQTLDEEFQYMLRAMEENSMYTRNVVLLTRKHTTLQGFPALIVTMRYVRSPNDAPVFSKLILIRTTGRFSRTYDLGLTCHSDDVAVLLPVFERIASTFKILGPPE
jgi:hypothetical protein